MRKQTQTRTRAAIAARPTSPAAALNRNGYITLFVAIVLAVFGAAALLGAGGQWSGLTLWLAGAVAFFGATSLLCFTLAARRGGTRTVARFQRPAQVTHPEVSHLVAHPSPNNS